MSDRQYLAPMPRLWSRASASRLVSPVASSDPPQLKDCFRSLPVQRYAALGSRATVRNLTNARSYVQFQSGRRSHVASWSPPSTRRSATYHIVECEAVVHRSKVGARLPNRITKRRPQDEQNWSA